MALYSFDFAENTKHKILKNKFAQYLGNRNTHFETFRPLKFPKYRIGFRIVFHCAERTENLEIGISQD